MSLDRSALVDLFGDDGLARVPTFKEQLQVETSTSEIIRRFPSCGWGVKEWTAVLRADHDLYLDLLEAMARAGERGRG